MITTITFVKMQPGYEREAFYGRWCEHTRDLDLRDHPEISLNRLTLFEEDSEFVGMAENHWPDREALDAAIGWYGTPEGQAHQKDLESFMDTANSPTMVVSHEVEVSREKGIEWKACPASAG
ncbi:MAG: hypothetical protein JRH16_18585 [Deltaproteobacteria bacterium]|nr:hypothetical protein [Deltaproteobacteria bacterium]MBW2362310.1 hypothetical protein [Deltaproteobacteria bacterium]